MTGQAGHRLLLVNAPPAPHRGEDNARPVPFELPSVPRIKREAATYSVSRKKGIQGARLHNSDYVKELRPTFERINPTRPVGVAAGKEFCSRAIPGPGPSQNSALCGSPPTKCTPVSREKGKSTVIPRPAFFFLPPRAAQLRVGPVPKVVCRSRPATPPSSPFLQGTASPWFNLPAIPPGTVSFLLCARSSLRVGPCSAKTPQSLPGRQEAAVRIRSRLLAQRMPPSPRTQCQATTPSFRQRPVAGLTPVAPVTGSSPPSLPATIPRRQSSTAPETRCQA